MTPAKFLRTAFGIRGLSSAYISKVFLRTEMALKSRSVIAVSRSLARSRSTDNLPTSQSQVNIQMMSHTLTIREVCYEITKTFHSNSNKNKTTISFCPAIENLFYRVSNKLNFCCKRKRIAGHYEQLTSTITYYFFYGKTNYMHTSNVTINSKVKVQIA